MLRLSIIFGKCFGSWTPSELARGGVEGRHYSLSFGFLGWCLAELGEFDEAGIVAAEGIEASEILNQSFPIAWIRFCAARVYQLKGDARRSIALLQRAIEACATGRIPNVVPWVASTLGNCLVETGQVDEGFRYLKQANSEEVMRPAIKGTLPLIQLGEAHLRVGQVSEARMIATWAIEICEAAGERAHEAWSRLLLWQCACLGGRSDQDESGWRTLAQALGMKALVERADKFKSSRDAIRLV